MLVVAGAAESREDGRRHKVGLAEVVELIFGLGRPVLGEHVFQTGADGEAIVMAVVDHERLRHPVDRHRAGDEGCDIEAAVRDQLQDRIAIIVDGGTSPREVASTIIDLTDEEARWRIMREGAIPALEISEFFAQG